MADLLLSGAEIDAFADKLRAFGETLTPKEQFILASLLIDQAQGEEDVVGHHGYVDPSVNPFLLLQHAHMQLEHWHHLVRELVAQLSNHHIRHRNTPVYRLVNFRLP